MKEGRKLSKKILTVLLAVVLLVTGMAVSVPAASRITVRGGKVYQNNKLVVNRIIGSKAQGYYYVDKTGRRVNTREIRQAVNFVMKNSRAGDSSARRLKDCYYYAAAMACIARVLGYDSRVAVGGVTARGKYAALSLHGWCEVKYRRSWRMIDCSMQRAHMDRNLYLVTRRQYPFRLRCDRVYNMVVRNARVRWF